LTLLTKKGFIGAWRSIPSEKEKTERFNGLETQNLDEIQKTLSAQHMFFIAKRVPNPQQVVLYFYSYLLDDALVLLELTFKPGVDACQVCVKSKQAHVAPIFLQSIKAAITN
jgi:AP-1 complex subunit beta-1